MKDLNMLNSGFMEDQICKQWSLSNFLQHFGCDEEAFLNRLMLLYKNAPEEAKKKIKLLKKREEKQKRAADKRARKKQVSNINLSVTNSANNEICVLDVKAVENMCSTVNVHKEESKDVSKFNVSNIQNKANSEVTTNSIKMDDLTILTEERDKKLEKLRDLENSKVKINDESKQNQRDLEKIFTKVEKMEKELKELSKMAISLIDTVRIKRLEISRLDKLIIDSRKDIEKTNNQIQQLTTIKIAIGFKPKDDSFIILEIAEKEKEILKAKMFEIYQELPEQITIGEAKKVANMIVAYEEKIKEFNSNNKIEIYFPKSDEKISSIFEKIIGKKVNIIV